MGMAITMREYLTHNGVTYDVLTHPYEVTATGIVRRTRITGDRLAKAVLLSGESGHKLAVLPGSCRVDLRQLSQLFHERVGLSTEDEIGSRFADCERGALPPVGQPYGVPVCVDDSLYEQPDIYFEAGDHRTLVHMSGDEFRRLMGNAMHGRFSRHA